MDDQPKRELYEWQYKIVGGIEPYVREPWVFYTLVERTDEMRGHWWIFRRQTIPSESAAGNNNQSISEKSDE